VKEPFPACGLLCAHLAKQARSRVGMRAKSLKMRAFFTQTEIRFA
jgi:hypothetical protein